MCSVKTPKPPPTTSASQQKPPVYMRNAYLDGLGINSENAGRNSLRIDLGSRVPTRPVAAPVVAPPLFTPPPFNGNPTTGIGIGAGGGVRGNRGGLGLGIRLL